MLRKLLARWSGAVSAQRRRASTSVCQIESLEQRRLLSVPPHVVNTFADNRGRIVIRFDQEMDRSTVNTDSVILYTTTANGQATPDLRVSLNSAGTQLTVRTVAELRANRAYKLKLVANKIRGVNGARLDGEFVSFSKPSGDGVPGGDYFFSAKPYTDKFVARYTTSLGIMDVRLFADKAPKTVANFMKYANAGRYDLSVFHRSVKSPPNPFGTIQGGAMYDTLQTIEPFATIPLESAAGLSNARGTLSMYGPSGPNSATSQWFFNTTNNPSLDGSFAVFGEVVNQSSRRMMDKIARQPTMQVGDHTDFPYQQIGEMAKLIYIKRLAIRMAIKRA